MRFYSLRLRWLSQYNSFNGESLNGADKLRFCAGGVYFFHRRVLILCFALRRQRERDKHKQTDRKKGDRGRETARGVRRTHKASVSVVLCIGIHSRQSAVKISFRPVLPTGQAFKVQFCNRQKHRRRSTSE